MPFRDRIDAGRQLAAQVAAMGLSSPIVLGLPRGGLPVAAEIAAALDAPLDVFVARKVGVPGQEEVGIGAVAEGLADPVRSDLATRLGIDAREFAWLAEQARGELRRRVSAYRGDRPLPALTDRDVVLVDDGLATGVTAEAALRALRAERPRRLILAVPVCAKDTAERLADIADDVVCSERPPFFRAVGQWYENFEQTTDAEVLDLLRRGRESRQPSSAPGGSSRSVEIELPDATLRGDLVVPADSRAIVVFAHGSGSGRHSPRNRQVAERLQRDGLSTLLLDLLTDDEEQVDMRSGHLRFDIGLLARRLAGTVDWIDGELTSESADGERWQIGYFGASTGAGAALVATAEHGDRIGAVVSRGGRPDLAGALLGEVRAPTLLIVGGRDDVVLQLNRQAQQLMHGTTHLEVVPGATHLFEETGALEHVAMLAAQWFTTHLTGVAAGPRGQGR